MLAMTFEVILYKTLHKEIGLKSFMVVGFKVLGIRTMEVLLT